LVVSWLLVANAEALLTGNTSSRFADVRDQQNDANYDIENDAERVVIVEREVQEQSGSD